MSVLVYPAAHESCCICCPSASLIHLLLSIFFVGFKQLYEHYFKIPYFVFMRDMTSYLALLALHIAICLESSQLPLSDLEWAILVFLLGRLLVEIKQVKDYARSKGIPLLIAQVNYSHR